MLDGDRQVNRRIEIWKDATVLVDGDGVLRTLSAHRIYGVEAIRVQSGVMYVWQVLVPPIKLY